MEQRTIRNLRKALANLVTDTGYILDCGCGDYGSWDYANEQITKPRMFENGFGGKVYATDIKFGQDVQNLGNFQSNTFDIVVFAGVIQYVHKHQQAFNEIFRVLKQDGVLILATVNDNCLWRRLGIIKNGPKNDERYIYTFKDIEHMFNDRILESAGVDFIPLPKQLCSNMVFVIAK